MSGADQALLGEFLSAAVEDLGILTVLHGGELSRELVLDLRRLGFPTALGLPPGSTEGRQAMEVLETALGGLSEGPTDEEMDGLAADYAAIYLNYSLKVTPSESAWIDDEELACQDAMFQIRDWYRRYGFKSENWRKRSDDHLVLQLDFIRRLLDGEQGGERMGEVAQFLDEHLLRWIGGFAERVATRCDTPFYAGLAMLTATWLDEFRNLLALVTERPRPTPEEVEKHLSGGPRLEREGEFCGAAGAAA